MNFPIIYRAHFLVLDGFFIFSILVPIFATGMGLSLFYDTHDSFYLWYIASSFIPFLALLGYRTIRTIAEKDTRYIVTADSFVLSQKGSFTCYSYQTYAFYGSAIQHYGKKVRYKECYLQIKKSLNNNESYRIFLKESSFNQLMQDIHFAQELFSSPISPVHG